MADEAPDHDDSDVLQINLNDGTAWRLVGWRNVLRWLSDLEKAWAWVRDDLTDADPVSAKGNLLSILDAVRREATAAKTRGDNPASFANELRRLMNETWGPYHQDSVKGSLISDIQAEAGNDAALFAYAFLRHQVTFGHISAPSHFRGMMLIAQPSLALTSDPGERLNAERNNFRGATRRLATEMQEAERIRSQDWNESLRLAGDAAAAWSQRRAKRWLRYVIAWRRLHNQSIASIQGVENSYREAMALQAPVEYWTKKAVGHKKAEASALGRLMVYFPVALLLITGLFAGSAAYLLNVPQAALPPGLYVIASAGLASAAGLLFWIGRLLTKLYLSEHHLRHDAEERAR